MEMSKEDFAVALRAHHAAVDATKSPQRDAAAKVIADIQREAAKDNNAWHEVSIQYKLPLMQQSCNRGNCESLHEGDYVS